MKSSNSSKPVAQIVAGIQALNLDPIKVKLMDTDEGQGWSREYADRVEIGYKQFLTLLVTHPETTIAPNKEIDKFWHAHILDTMKYADDCQQVFGYFLHHFPYFGMRSAEDAAQLEQASRDTQRLFAEEFSDVMPGAAAHCYAAKPEAASAHCYAAVSGPASAHCYAAKPESASAHCYAAVSEYAPAHCYAAKPEAASAHCYATVSESASAHCYATVSESASAHCYAAKPDVASAHCYATVSESASAHCYAAKPDAASAHCYATLSESVPGFGAAANADRMARPTLALAA